MKVKKKEHRFWRALGRFLPYLVTAVLVFALAKFGSDDKFIVSSAGINMNAMASSNTVSADQLSELYVVASLSSSFDLASVDTVSGNYVSASVLREISQTSTDRIEKPGYVAVQTARGVINYIVAEGDTMESIAQKRGLTTDQIRWSNNLKTTDVAVGQVLTIPSISGIVYTVKNGDTPESLATRYHSDQVSIRSVNDLENSQMVVGMQIVLPGGILPETERPEYVPAYTYSYRGDTSDRQNMRVVYDAVTAGGNNRMVWGQCTYYAWWWRWANGNPLPDALTGDAKYWAVNARRLGMQVDNIPSAGAVFQTTAGWWGHVGIVLNVNADGSLLVREMNYGYRSNVVTESIIPASSVGNFSYIH